ncbi:MAG: hypothetical protein KJ069_06780 [Anaerolineae bacterium]|nr:hypothetical protein [Anaerolineae bacterium]
MQPSSPDPANRAAGRRSHLAFADRQPLTETVAPMGIGSMIGRFWVACWWALCQPRG